MFNLYKTKDVQNNNKDFYKNLNILRLDCTEKNIFDYRFIDDNFKNNNKILENNFQENKNKILKNIAFISNDFSLLRPTGILCKDFFNKLIKIESNLNFFFISKLPIKTPFNINKNSFSNSDVNKIKEYIEKNNIDIIIDMQGHMVRNYNELLSNRLAPIQIHFLGYPGTIGISSIDYLIADKTIIPEDSCKFYREKIAYLPNCYQANCESNLISKKINNYNNVFKFCNFNNHYKFDKKLIFVWIDILKKVPNSVIYLVTDKLDKNIQMYASYNKIKNRIFFLKKVSHEKHLKRISTMDLGLDSYRLNGHTTSSDLICSGVPLITYTSETYQNRVSKSILKSLDLEDLVCYSYNDYINLAVKIATDKQYHINLINKVKNNRIKTLFNSTLYTTNFINLLNNIWKHHYTNSMDENKLTITNFGHNKKYQNYKWNYIPYVRIDLDYFNNHENMGLITVINCEGQILRDIADNNENCFIFSTSGMLFKDNPILLTKLIKDNNYNVGIWYKSIYNKDFIQNLDIEQYNSINKDYNLPQVLIIFNIDKILNFNYKNIIQYIIDQSYLNIKLIINCSNQQLKNKFINYKINNDELIDYDILCREEVEEVIKKNNNTFKLIFNNSNISKILNNHKYIQQAIDKNPNNFMIL